MSDPKHECGPGSGIGAELCRGDYKPLTEKHKRRETMLGIELPFGWCLVRGSVFRDLQTKLREAQQTAELRTRICWQLLEKLNRKGLR